MNKCGLYCGHSWKNVNMAAKPYIKRIFGDIYLFQYLTILSLPIFSISKALSWNREVETTQKGPLFMRASSFCFCSELVAMRVSIYICIHVCKYMCIYICTYVCRYVHRNSHTDDANSQSLAFLPKTTLKIKHKLLYNASLKLKLDHQIGEIHN